MTPPKSEYQNRPVTVSGSQTGVDDAKDTVKATESLKIKRKKEEGTYIDPNLTTADKLTRRSGRGGVVARNKRSAKLRGKTKTKSSSNRTGGRV